ncbi:hypothetical protein [Riemerella columbina]|uniref:hypothetical protein n=1 Tax=Riemerella columbina TaxID=103810 RepID=UPI00266EA921|nr:hypothetical protein [Riemerella columbina]WKS94938.1 hypothetical protein NYR17_08415 [Riemerella columbina]
MWHILRKISVILTMFGALFPISFIFLPGVASSRFLIALIGVVLFLKDLSKAKNNQILRTVLYLIFFSLLLCIWSILCSYIFNIYGDDSYVKYPFTLVVMLLSAYVPIYLIEKEYGEANFINITRYFLYTILLQSLFALLMYFITPFANFLVSLQRISDFAISIINYHLNVKTRFIGFGLLFYTASFFYATALILIAYSIKFKVKIFKNNIPLILLYILFSIVGMGLSRSTIFGVFLSLLVLLLFNNHHYFSYKKILTYFSYIAIIIVGIVALFNILDLAKYEALINNAFGFIVKFYENGDLESESAKGTMDYFILPQNDMVYLIGTGVNGSEDVSFGDYVYSDIGYLRLLYYFGIPGMLLYLWIEIYALKVAFWNKGYTLLFLLLVTVLLIINVKGIATLLIIALLYCYQTPKEKL